LGRGGSGVWRLWPEREEEKELPSHRYRKSFPDFRLSISNIFTYGIFVNDIFISVNKFLQVGGKDAHDSVPRAYGRAGYDVPVWRVAQSATFRLKPYGAASEQ
jgi:hypothetical protein